MKGKSPSAEQRRFHDALVQHIGCVACRIDDRRNHWVSIHHIDGRTKPTAHWLVLPLCGPHHQDCGYGVVAVHPWKARFESMYGTQRELLGQCIDILIAGGVDVPEGALLAAGKKMPSAGGTQPGRCQPAKEVA